MTEKQEQNLKRYIEMYGKPELIVVNPDNINLFQPICDKFDIKLSSHRFVELDSFLMMKGQLVKI